MSAPSNKSRIRLAQAVERSGGKNSLGFGALCEQQLNVRIRL
jgi:hypothetical protein